MMSSSERERELAGVLGGGADPLTFRVVLGLLDSWPETQGRTAGVAAAEAGLAAWPDAERGVETAWEVLEPLLASPSWPVVRALGLDLGGAEEAGESPPEALARLAPFGCLTRLSLQGDSEGEVIGPAGLAALAASPHLQGLEALGLDGVTSDRAALALLGDAASLPGLRELSAFTYAEPLGRARADLWSPALTPGRLQHLSHLECNRLMPEDVERLRAGPPGTLRSLSVVELSHEALDRLLGSPGLVAGIERLRVAVYPQGEAAIGRLIACWHWAGLRELDLSDNGLGAATVAALAASGLAGQLRVLRLADNPLGDEGWVRLARGSWPHLAALDLRNTAATDRGLAALAGAPGLPGLRQLEASDNGFSAAGAHALASSAWAKGLTDLLARQDRSGFGDDGVVALARGGLAHLRALDLYKGEVGARGAAALAASGARFRSLDLSFNPIGDAGAAAFAESGALRDVRDLQFNLCGVGDEGLARLAADGRLLEMRTLGLGGDKVTAVGVRALANSPCAARLWELSVRGNPIGRQGAEALAGSPYLRQLIHLDLQLCGLDAPSAALLCESPVVERLEHVVLDVTPASKPWAQCQRLRPVVKANLAHLLAR